MPINGFANQAHKMYVPGLGIKIFWRWECGSDASRFFDASRIFAKSARAEEDRVGKARSPREATQCKSVTWLSKAPTSSHHDDSIVLAGHDISVSL